jgi:hypothetical protein
MANLTRNAALVGLSVLALAESASAAEVTRVLTARSLKDFDVHVSVDWQHESSKASVKREYVQTTGTAIVNDLIYRQTRDSMQLRAEAALVQDLSFALTGSFVSADQRSLEFDRSGDCAATPCLETCCATASCPAPKAPAGASTPKWGAVPITVRSGLSRSRPQRFRIPRPRSRLGSHESGSRPHQAHVGRRLETRLSVGDDQRFDPRQAHCQPRRGTRLSPDFS